jgi:hypothetical protein
MARSLQTMKSMERDDDDKLDSIAAIPILKLDFPPGLRIALTEKEFEKLDIDHSEAEVGGLVHGHFMGRVTHVSQDQQADGEQCCRVEIQIEDLEIECSEGDEEEDE